MLTTPPILHIRRPSPTTAEFTVTTCPPPTAWLRIALLVVLAMRTAFLAGALLLLYSAWALLPFASRPGPYPSRPPELSLDMVAYLPWAAHVSPAGQLATRLAQQVPAWATLGVCAAALYASLAMRVHTTERLLVLRGLGIQTTTAGWGGTRFIPTGKIRDVLINEAFRGFEVRYYLLVVVEGEEDVVAVFPRLLPGRKVVETVWRGVRACLYEHPDEGVQVSGGDG